MAMKLAPNASLTWLSYALSCFPQHLFGPEGSAIEDALHHAIPIPDTAEIRKGLEAYEQGEWAEAVRWFEGALAKGAPDSAPHLLLAISQLRLGKTEDALGHLVTAKNLEEAGQQRSEPKKASLLQLRPSQKTPLQNLRQNFSHTVTNRRTS